jgi:hypothetical protein
MRDRACEGKNDTSRKPSTSTGTRRFVPQVSNSKPASLFAAHAITALPSSIPAATCSQITTGFCVVPMDFHDVTGKSWEIWLEYEDIFEQYFCSVHHKRPVQLENSRLISESTDGQYYAPPQPWVTFPSPAPVHNSCRPCEKSGKRNRQRRRRRLWQKALLRPWTGAPRVRQAPHCRRVGAS